MNASTHRLRTLALGAALGAAAMGLFALVAAERDSVESAAAASAQRQVVEETKTQRSGRFAYVRTSFPVPAGSTAAGEAFCPRRAQLTGAFGSGSSSSAAGTTLLPVSVFSADGGDRGKVRDNGAFATVQNATSIEGEAAIEAICMLAKKRKR
jgi:hypothetical protein